MHFVIADCCVAVHGPLRRLAVGHLTNWPLSAFEQSIGSRTVLRNIERWYNVISRFTAELVAEIDELEALLAAPVRNNSSAQNGTY